MGVSHKQDRIRSLDGLRAISIIFVLIGHAAGTRYFPLKPNDYLSALAYLGVNVFFVISGFLITGFLLKELESEGRIDLTRFYFRRTLRIFPAYYAFVLILLIVQQAGAIHLNNGDALHALTYTANYDQNRSWWIGHTWSLSVEEQFYLLCAPLLALSGKRRALIAGLLVIMLAPVARLTIWYLFPIYRDGIGRQFETVADSLAVGCILAGLRGWLHRSSYYQWLLSSRLFVAAPLGVLLFGVILSGRPRITYAVGETITIICVGLCIDWCVTNNAGYIGAVLNWRPIVGIGVLSYSIYLWQQIFVNRQVVSVWTSFPLNLILTAAAALLSYYLIEEPALGLRRTWEKRIFAKRPAPHPTVGSAVASEQPAAAD